MTIAANATTLTSGQTIGTLPESMRPFMPIYVPIFQSSSSATEYKALMRIETNGALYVMSGATLGNIRTGASWITS